ncbi:Sucrase/ferredoxin-like-domain-containing protein [Glomus cerebriforme]|uniref:Sucrase/ferredoxin-like-domain-containing protein n=1 Tax=Glomus cerebriforme TaxID=658196 RepID=A0A397S4L1_9GLOM|nr:Sucrase/ferredoxin-like-domain-containing protein [Glomus cerebriforme]
MPKPIYRLSSKFVNVISSAFSSSRFESSSSSSEKEVHSKDKSLSSSPPPPSSPPVTTQPVSEFPDAETAALLQTVPSSHELITFDELQQLEKSDEDPCLNCLDPCASHTNYPSYLKIDYEAPLYNTVKPYIKHVLISTGKGDWHTNIEDECGSLASSFHKVINNAKLNEKKLKNNDHQQNQQEHENTDHTRIIITNSSRKNSENDSLFSKGNDVLLFPENILIKNVTTKQVTDFYKKFLLSDDNNNNYLDDNNFLIEKMPYKAVIVICSHKRRDKRCGVTGPLLKDEFDKILKEKGLEPKSNNTDGVGVFLSSHTGGHRFAGNVIVYKEGKGIWYGRVTPCHAKSIIDHTIIEGKVIKDLYRGSMNGSFASGCGGRNFDW